MLYFFLLLSLAIETKAQEYCDPVSEIKPFTEDCDDNYNYVDAARECVEDYQFLVKSRKKDFLNLLEKDLAKKNSTAQNLDFKNTKSIYDSTLEELDDLIATGEQASSEIQAYEENLVPGFEWDDLGVGPFPGRKSPAVQEEYKKDMCYYLSTDEIALVQKELSNVVKDLKEAKTKTLERKTVASQRETTIKNDGTPSPVVKSVDPQGEKKVENPAPSRAGPRKSDVSGTEKVEKSPEK